MVCGSLCSTHLKGDTMKAKIDIEFLEEVLGIITSAIPIPEAYPEKDQKTINHLKSIVNEYSSRMDDIRRERSE